MQAPDLEPDRLFEGLTGVGPLLVAVSGGPDSMALLHLLTVWARKRSVEIAAATVDHGLRPESCDEAEQVGRWAAALGVPHEVLVWEGSKPGARVQERARKARYDLLFAHARRVGASAVVTAHHADDQAETVLFRFLRGSGPAGLAGMAPLVRRGDLVLARPLLGVPKARLVGHCQACGQAFFEDPSNVDPRYARTRMRKLLSLLEEQGFDPADLGRLAARAARAEEALDTAAKKLFASLAAVREGDVFRCDLRPLRDEPLEYLVRLLVQEVGARSPGTVRLERAERLATRLAAALREASSLRATLGGSLVCLDPLGTLVLTPAPPRRSGAADHAATPSAAEVTAAFDLTP